MPLAAASVKPDGLADVGSCSGMSRRYLVTLTESGRAVTVAVGVFPIGQRWVAVPLRTAVFLQLVSRPFHSHIRVVLRPGSDAAPLLLGACTVVDDGTHSWLRAVGTTWGSRQGH